MDLQVTYQSTADMQPVLYTNVEGKFILPKSNFFHIPMFIVSKVNWGKGLRIISIKK